MPVHMGIMCERCRKIHFIATSPGIKPNPVTPEMYLITCRLPCPETREFRKETMCPYRVSEEVFKAGFAEESECELIPAGEKEEKKQTPKGR